MVGIAVKVTDSPSQIVVPGFAEMLTETGKFGFTVIVKILDVAKLSVTQTAFDVRTQITVSPSDNEAFVYVAILLPTSNPLSCH